MRLGAFRDEDLRKVLRALANNKASGPDRIPAEYWKRLGENEEARSILQEFVNTCWAAACVPAEWHIAYVSAIHKKGRTDNCENYRPINLLCVGYKVYASLLRQRLVQAGAEGRLSKTQFGFRTGCGTVDAIFILRRRIEIALAQRSGRALILALDWQKAFDSVDSVALLAGLARFGVPQKMLNSIASIYTGRQFRVADCGSESELHGQCSGISQGCPLSLSLL